MTREIKFRAWDKAKREMLYAESHANPDRLKVSFSGTPIEEDSVQPNFVLMQFTGLKDKNWREVFEHDLLQLSSELHKEFGKQIYEVKWDDEQSAWNVIKPLGDYVVVGNVFEIAGVLDGGRM